MSSKEKTIGMKEGSNPTLVPKLRFPEFREANGWKSSVLANACDMQAGKFVSASNISERDKGGLFPCYGGNGRRGYTATYTHDGTYPLIGRQGALCGNVRLVSGKFHATEHAVVVTPKNSVDVVWLYYSLELLNLNQFATGQAQPGLSVDALENLSFAIPWYEFEQQKIADCLTSLDEAVAAQARKVDALKKHKKGLMQQLFPREGETQPRLRFPEFRDTGHWKSTPLGRLLERNPDYGVSLSAVPFSEELPTYLRITDISDDGLYLKEKRVSVDFEAKSENYLKLGDIVLARTGASVGKSYRYREEDGALVFAGFLIRIRPDQETLLPDFLSGYLASDTYWDWVAINSARSGQPGINSAEFSSLLIPCPPQISEQQRIAECLSGHDDLIAAESRKLEVLKRHKEGLMQQLFPSRAEDNA